MHFCIIFTLKLARMTLNIIGGVVMAKRISKEGERGWRKSFPGTNYCYRCTLTWVHLMA